MPKVPFEVISEQAQLKATFFANKLDTLDYIGMFEFAVANVKKVESSLKWNKADSFGIDKAICDSLIASGLSVPLHLCHPNLLLSNPRFVTYFRCIAALSQKGLKSLSGVSTIDRMERGLTQCSPEQALKIAIAINANLVGMYAVALPGPEKLKGIMYATAGTTIDGSWRNAIGSEGERVIRTLFLKELLAHGELLKVTTKSAKSLDGSDIDAKWLDENTAELQSAMATNGSIALFGSEPDIKLVDANSVVVGGVEIKAGIDPAGALERFGAMLKSFDNILIASSNAETILVASCITDEVEARIRTTKSVGRTFLMTDVIQNKGSQGTKLNNILRGCLGLTKASYQ